jgi:hypothetical protein
MAEQDIASTLVDRLKGGENGSIIRAISGMMLWLRYDDQSGGVLASDPGGYITTRKEFEEITAGMMKFFEHYSDEDIKQYNTEADERREQRRFEQAIQRKGNRKSAIGFIYLIRAENGLYKIGKAKNVSTRMQPFSVSFPMKWDLVYSFQANDYNYAEALLHQRYANKRDVGEWFKLSIDDVEYIKSLQDGQL